MTVLVCILSWMRTKEKGIGEFGEDGVEGLGGVDERWGCNHDVNKLVN